MELVVFSGLQGSGKSTFYRERLSSTHVLVSKDQFPNARNRDRRQERMIREAVAEGRSVVVDNTNATIETRALLIILGHELGLRVVGYAFEIDAKACYDRNARRKGDARVPDVGFFATLKKMQPPTYAEGFDLLYSVRIGESGFEVKEIEK